MRSKLIQKLASAWRKAEDIFQETEDDSKKWKVYHQERLAKLTLPEKNELNSILKSMGV